MHRFSLSLALFATLAHADDVTNCLLGPLGPDCLKIDPPFYGFAVSPLYGNMVALQGTFNGRQVTTDDGYILSMVRIPYPNEMDGVFKGPVLLAHGLGGSAWNWFLGDNSQGDLPLWKRLLDAGYEPWLINNRGQVSSLEHTTTNLYQSDPELYFDYDSRELAYEDMPAFLEQIRSERQAEGRACKKTTILGHSNGARIGVISAGKPDDEGARINKVIGLAPAYQRALSYLNETDGPCQDLSTFEIEIEGSQEGSPFVVEDKSKFNRRREKYCRKQDNGSEGDKLTQKALKYCEKAPLSSKCQKTRPFRQDFFERIYDAQEELGYFSIFGPNRDQQLIDVCDYFGQSSYECGLYARANEGILGRGEISIKTLREYGQQVFTNQFDILSDTFDENGWYTDTPEFDLTATRAPIVNILVENDTTVDNDAAYRVSKQYTSNGVTTYTLGGGRNHVSIVGENTDELFSILEEELGENEDDMCV